MHGMHSFAAEPFCGITYTRMATVRLKMSPNWQKKINGKVMEEIWGVQPPPPVHSQSSYNPGNSLRCLIYVHNRDKDFCAFWQGILQYSRVKSFSDPPALLSSFSSFSFLVAYDMVQDFINTIVVRDRTFP